MRRLIAWIYIKWLGVSVKTHDQHVADLEQMLSDLLCAEKTLNAEIAATVHQLLAAHDECGVRGCSALLSAKGTMTLVELARWIAHLELHGTAKALASHGWLLGHLTFALSGARLFRASALQRAARLRLVGM